MAIFPHALRIAVALLTCCFAPALTAQETVPGLYDRPVLALDPGLHTAVIKRADIDAAGRTAVTGSEDKTVRVWSVADGKLIHTIRMPSGPGQCRQDLCRGNQPGRRHDRGGRVDA